MKKMNTIMKKVKSRKGFTLVEVIIVLVILAILAAMLIPALTGYIDKANEKKLTAECRSVVMAAQTYVSEYYALKGTAPDGGDVMTLAELPATSFAEIEATSGKITQVKYYDGVGSIQYTPAGGYVMDATPQALTANKMTIDGAVITES